MLYARLKTKERYVLIIWNESNIIYIYIDSTYMLGYYPIYRSKYNY